MSDLDANWLRQIGDSLEIHDRLHAWTGTVWRCYARAYAADSPGGSHRADGRFHRAAERHPASQSWPALYTACSSAIAIGEVVRYVVTFDPMNLSRLRMSELRVELQRVFVAYDPAADDVDSLLGLDYRRECAGFDHHRTQEFARLAREVAEAILVPTCTRLPEGNLIIFPDRTDARSTIRITGSTDLSLFKLRTERGEQ